MLGLGQSIVYGRFRLPTQRTFDVQLDEDADRRKLEDSNSYHFVHKLVHHFVGRSAGLRYVYWKLSRSVVIRCFFDEHTHTHAKYFHTKEAVVACYNR